MLFKKAAEIKLIRKTVFFTDILNGNIGVSYIDLCPSEYHFLNILTQWRSNLGFKLLLKGLRRNAESFCDLGGRDRDPAVFNNIFDGRFNERGMLGKLRKIDSRFKYAFKGAVL